MTLAHRFISRLPRAWVEHCADFLRRSPLGKHSYERLASSLKDHDGLVVAGDQRGGTLGYPTANIAMDPQLVCARYGIYAGEALGHRAAVSIGTNPHYGGTERRIEPFLLDFEGDLYGKRLVVELWERLRDEAVFGSEEELVAQIARDVEAVRAVARPA